MQLGRPRITLLLALLGACFLAWAVWRNDPRAIAATLSRLPSHVLFEVVVSVLVAYAVRFAKWHFYLRRLCLQVSLPRSAAVFTAGLVMVVTPGKVGEVWKALALQEAQGIPVSRSLPAVALERLTDFLAIAALAVLAAASLGFAAWLAGLAVAAMVLGVAALRWRRPWMALIARLDRRAPGGRLVGFLHALYEGTNSLLTPGALAFGATFGMVAWGLEGFALHLILSGLGVPNATLWAVGVFAAGTLAGALSVLPAGLGTTEIGMVGLLVSGGVATTTALAATVLARVLTLGLGAAIGAVAFIGWSFTKRGRAPSA